MSARPFRPTSSNGATTVIAGAIRLAGRGLVRKLAQTCIGCPRLHSGKHSLQRLIRRQAAIYKTADYIERNRERAAGGSTFRELTHPGTVNSLPHRLGASFYLISRGFPRARLLNGHSRSLHPFRVVVNGTGDVFGLHSLGREFKRTLLERFRRQLAGTRVCDGGKNVLRHIGRQSFP